MLKNITSQLDRILPTWETNYQQKFKHIMMRTNALNPNLFQTIHIVDSKIILYVKLDIHIEYWTDTEYK